MDKVSTKQRILDSALMLFSDKGYDGTGVDEIAENAGIKGPSLYRHFKSKEDILKTLIVDGETYYEKNFGSTSKPGKLPENLEEFIQGTLKRLSFTMHDKTIQRLRRVFTQEQFKNADVAAMATKHSIDGLTDMYHRIFSAMINEKLLKEDDPELLAMEFVLPVTVLIQVYDRQPEKEQEVMTKIEKHIRHFVCEYAIRMENI